MKLTAAQAEVWHRLLAKEALAEALLSRAGIRCEGWQPAALRVGAQTYSIVHGLKSKVQEEMNYFLDSLILDAKREADCD